MSISSIRFSKDHNQDFYKVLQQRVSSYFKTENISRHGNINMFIKTIVMLAMYIVPFSMLFVLENSILLTLMWVIMGFGMAGIGLSVMHDANHGSYSKNQFVNKLIGHVITIIGGLDVTWKIQHNVLHHTYTNVTGMDEDVAKLLRKVDKPVFLAVNKVDNNKRAEDAVEFYSLGLGDYYTIASINGSGTGELLDALVAALPDEPEIEEEALPRFAVVGRPNAGKSSLINALIGEDRYIVTDIAGTTRDSIDTKYNRFGFEFNLVDTAGIRRKSKVKEDLEFYSVMRSVRAIEHCDICLLVFDSTRGFDGQVQNIFWLAERNRKGIVILANKWDLVDKETNTMKKFEAYIRKQCEPFTDIPILFISALTKQRIYKAIETAVEVYKNRSKKIKTRQLNDVLLPIIQNNPPPAYKGKYVKIKFITQLPTPQPQFAFFCNLPQYIKDPYKRFLENQLRKHFDFHGVPVTVYMRKK